MSILYTIGHSNRSVEDFLHILHAHKIDHVVDVRTIPKSSYVPHFNKESIKSVLLKEGIQYTHMPELGGLRRPWPDSINNAWRNSGFRGFADYMQTNEFFQALKKLMNIAKKTKAAIMCAEAVPWRCHRSLIADALVVRKVKVLDIMNDHTVRAHKLTDFARIDRNKRPMRIYYPIKD